MLNLSEIMAIIDALFTKFLTFLRFILNFPPLPSRIIKNIHPWIFVPDIRVCTDDPASILIPSTICLCSLTVTSCQTILRVRQQIWRQSSLLTWPGSASKDGPHCTGQYTGAGDWWNI